MKIKILTPMLIDGEHYGSGQVVEISKDEARYLIGSNRAAPHTEKPAAPAKSARKTEDEGA